MQDLHWPEAPWVKGFEENYPVDQLKPASWNPRAIDPGNKKVLARSLQKFGFLEWIVADSKDSTVLGGHQRLAILKEQGTTHVPVLFVDADEMKQRQINVALNNPHIEGDWDMPALGELQEELKGSEDYEDLELGDIATGTIRREETSTEQATDENGRAKPGEYLKVFRLHFLPDEWAFFEKKANETMEKNGLENYSELVLWLAREAA